MSVVVSPDSLPAAVLNELLLLPQYRSLWGQFVRRKRGNKINIRAVATYLAYELSDEAGFELSPDKLKDSVRRALNGDLITDRTANRFITGFGFTPVEAQLLRGAIVQQRKMEVRVDGDAPRVARTTSDVIPYRTLEQTVQVFCDKNGLTKSFEVVNCFMVEADRLEFVKPLVEASAVQIEVLEGGELININEMPLGHERYHAHSAHGLAIKLPYVLRKNEVHRLRMKVNINETHADLDPDDALNFFITGSTDKPSFNLTAIVHFEEAPEYVSSAIWDDHFENPIHEEQLEPGLSRVSLYAPMTFKSLMGFRWSVRSEKKHVVRGSAL